MFLRFDKSKGCRNISNNVILPTSSISSVRYSGSTLTADRTLERLKIDAITLPKVSFTWLVKTMPVVAM